jgi:tetratricopeptide (TPR) repeat protein
MTRARRLWVVAAGIVTAALINSFSQGEAVDNQAPVVRPKRPAALEAAAPVADNAPSRFDKAGIVTYRTLKDDSYFALQVQPELPAVARRPRDMLILVSSSAAQAGPAWVASRQLAEGVIQRAGESDTISLWVVSTPEFTESLTRDFVPAKGDAKKLASAITQLKDKVYPAGDIDLKNGIAKAVRSFDGRKSRQRLILFFGDGFSTDNPITAAERQDLCKTMIENRIAFYAVPLGGKLEPQNLHGFATGTGGAVLRTQIMEEALDDVLTRYEKAFRAPILYPEEFQLAAASEFYPAALPPVRGDAPTLVVGKLKDAKELTYSIKGEIAGGPENFAKTVKQDVPGAELDNFFLVGMVQQWQKARANPALIRADRALALAYEQTRLQHHEDLLLAELAVQKNELAAAARLFAKVKEIAPHDQEADAGLKIVARLKAGHLTLDQIRKELAKDRPVDKLEKVNGRARWAKDQIVHLAQLGAKDEGKEEAAGGPAGNGDAENLLQNRKDRIAIEEQKMSQMVEANLRQARRDLGTDPDAALDLLRNTLIQLRDHPDLSDNLREALMTRLQAALRDVTSQGRAIKMRKEQEQLNVAQVKKRRDDEQQRQTWEERAEAQYRIYKSLMNTARVEERVRDEVLAGLMDMRAQAQMHGQPVPTPALASYYITMADYHLQQFTDLNRLRSRRFLEVMLAVEKSHVPFPDEPGIYFPPLSTWEAIRKLRKEKYEVSSLPDDDQGKKEANAIKKLLEEEVDMKDFQQPMSLKEALGLLMEKFEIKNKSLPIMVDQGAFKEENPEGAGIYDTQVSFQPFPKKMRLATVLRLMLSKTDPPNATYLIRRNFLEITTIDRQTRERVLRVYPVGDLVMPISQQIGILGAGGGLGMMGMRGGGMMGGMMGGGMMGMGGGMMGMGGGMMGMGGGMMGMMGMGGGMMGMMGMGGGMNMMGMGMGGMMMGGMPGMGMGGMGMMGMGGMGMMGGGMMMGGMGMGGGMMMGGMGMGGGMMMGGMGMGGNFRGGSFMGGFNGGLGLVGSINAPSLIATITQVVAPGEWFVTQQPEPFNQFLGGGLNNFMGGVGVIGGQALGNIGQPPPPQGTLLDPTQANTIQFFPPALALIVRAPSRIHTDFTGGLIGAKQKRVEAMMDARDGLEAIRPMSTGQINNARQARAAKAKQVAAAQADPTKVWQQALVKENIQPGMVIATADFLFEAGKYDHAAEFLKATLRQGVVVRPWVYEALAVALEASGGKPEEVRRARLSAVALDPNDAQGFLEAARTMGQYKQWDRALAFCRQAASLEPNLAQPYAEALGFAELGKNSQAMEWAVGQLLSQDWPVDNQSLHQRAQSRLESLAKLLATEDRQSEVKRLKAALEKVRERDLVVKLTWENGSDRADLDLVVKEPGGSVCSLEARQTPGGGILIGNTLSEMNRASYVAAQAFSGEYEITVHRNWGQPLGNRARLEIIQHYGTARESRHLAVLSLDQRQIVKVVLSQGRRTTLATVPPPAAQRAEATDAGHSKSVYDKLRELVNPDYAGSKVIRAGAYTPGATLPSLPDQGMRKQPEHRVFQTAIPSQGGSGVNLAAQARLSADQRYLRLSVNPVFQTANGQGPSVNLPLIPGGATP